MPRFASFDGTELAYEVRGRGSPVLLIHGVAAHSALNWVYPGFVDALEASGRRVITLDLRGHGCSGRPADPEAYARGALARDAVGLLDELGVEQVDVVAYSMGSIVAAQVLTTDRRVRSVLLGGAGERFRWYASPEGRRWLTTLAAVVAAHEPSPGAPADALAMRAFVDSTGADRAAVAACLRGVWGDWPDLADTRVPVLVVTGKDDSLAGAPEPLAATIPGAQVRSIAGEQILAVTRPAFGDAMFDFLDAVDYLHGGDRPARPAYFQPSAGDGPVSGRRPANG